MKTSENNLVRKLCDIEELKANKAKYGLLVDGLVPDADEDKIDRLVDLFTEDATFDFGGRFGVFGGVEQIRKFYGETLPSQRSWIWHSFHNPLIEVTGDRATGNWTISAMAVSKGQESMPPQIITGRYEDEYIRIDGCWRQCRLKFINESR